MAIAAALYSTKIRREMVDFEVYRTAGFTHITAGGTREGMRGPRGTTRRIFNGYFPVSQPGLDYLPLERHDEIRRGDWLFVHNGSSDVKGCHSVIFLRWLDRAAMLCECACSIGAPRGRTTRWYLGDGRRGTPVAVVYRAIPSPSPPPRAR